VIFSEPLPAAPDPHGAIEKYRLHAAGYDASARRMQALRRRAIGLLGLGPGETVLDVACGTGLSLPQLAAGVGPAGRVIGIELSPDMIARARQRAAAERLENVTLLEAAAEDAALDARFDAALFHYTHDVLQSPRSLERLFSFARPGARVVLAGVKHPPAWLFPLRLYRVLKARPYVTTLSGLDRPWRLAEPYLEALHVEQLLLGTHYLARATVRG
jgi:demethylmenaquinone methyltransferase/2-methoxy-6-polyprenyl-1,4-benzoquinol methylase